MLKKLLPARGVDISSESFTFIIDETDNAVEKIIEQIVVSSFEKLCHEAFSLMSSDYNRAHVHC